MRLESNEYFAQLESFVLQCYCWLAKCYMSCMCRHALKSGLSPELLRGAVCENVRRCWSDIQTNFSFVSHLVKSEVPHVRTLKENLRRIHSV